MFTLKFHLFVVAGLVLLGQCSLQDRAHLPPPSLPVRVKRDAAPKPTNPLWESTWTDKLKQDLLLNYDKFARPMQHKNKTVVFLNPDLRHIELDEKRSIMTIHCAARMQWEDGKLKWDPDKYGGLSEIHLADHEVWQPDIIPFNSASGSSIDHYGSTNLIAFNNGSIVWIPPSIFQVFCHLDFTNWPFDVQTCLLSVGSWTYNGEEVDLYNSHEGKKLYEIEGLFPNSEWDFVSMRVEREEVTFPCCPSPYVDLNFRITIRRCSDTYRPLFIFPATALVLMTLGIFLFPPTSGEKITLGCAALIINALFILYFTQKLPVMTGSMPNIVSFYTACMYMLVIALLIAVAVINVTTCPKAPLPWIVKQYLREIVAKLIFFDFPIETAAPKPEEMQDNQPVLPEQGRQNPQDKLNSYQKDWILLGAVVDRICFVIYLFIFTFLIIHHVF